MLEKMEESGEGAEAGADELCGQKGTEEAFALR